MVSGLLPIPKKVLPISMDMPRLDPNGISSPSSLAKSKVDLFTVRGNW